MSKHPKKGGQAAPNKSFQDLVAQAAYNVMQPKVNTIIEQVVQLMMSQVRALTVQFDALKKGLETYTKFNNDEFLNNMWDIEDEEMRLIAQEVAEEGTKVRVLYDAINDGKEVAKEKFCVLQALAQSEKGAFQLPISIQQEIIGMKVGETKEIDFKAPEGEDHKVKFIVTVKRVSKAFEAEKKE